MNILLEAFEHAGKNAQYFALDLSFAELERTFSEIPTSRFQHVKLAALHGTYDDGLAWLRETADQYPSTCVMSLGSSIGNFSPTEAADFLKRFADVLGPADSLLIGLDACQDSKRIYKAYNDPENLTHEFYRNGLSHANRLLGYKAFRQEDWDIVGRYDEATSRHEAFYKALHDVVIAKTLFITGDMLKLENAYKYSGSQSDQLWHDAGLVQQISYSNERGDYSKSESCIYASCIVRIPSVYREQV